MYLVVLIIDETFKSQESMKKLFVSCSCFLVTTLLSVQADDKMDKQTDVVVEECVCQGPSQSPARVILLWGETPPNDELMAMFYDTRLLHFQDPRAPRFLLIDRKGRAALGIGGYVKATASYDFDGALPNRDFVTYDIPVPRNPAERNQYQMDVSTTRLFLKLVGANSVLGKYTVYVESDFRGGQDYGFRLRQAYVNARGFLVGQTWSTFVDPAAAPPTIDYEGPNGMTSVRNVMLRYTLDLSKHWQVALAAEAPSVTYTLSDGNNMAIRQRMPDIPFYVQYGWNEGNNHIRVSGLIRGLSYRDLMASRNKSVLGWAVQLSGLANITPKVMLYYQGVYGRGYDRYLNGLNGKGFDLIPDPDNQGKLYAPETLGYMAGIRYSFSQKFFISASYSQSRLYSKTGSLSENSYRYAQYIVGNAFYNLTPDCSIGLEYLYGRRSNINREDGQANRINAMIQYNF